MPADPVYDTIGRGYAQQRRPDPRIAAQVTAALGGACSVLNVGAGAGSYEAQDRRVVAVEPSAVMLAQRTPSAAPAVQARAEALPFPDRAFDAVMAVLTLHHWADRARGLAECARVARERVVLLTWDPAADGFWLVQDYFPEFMEADRRQFPGIPVYVEAFGQSARVQVAPVPVPRDCVDGFLGAYWARPEAYLDPAVRAGISSTEAVRSVTGNVRRAVTRYVVVTREVVYGPDSATYVITYLDLESLAIGSISNGEVGYVVVLKRSSRNKDSLYGTRYYNGIGTLSST
jgi:SAM-dependent methyltransferase